MPRLGTANVVASGGPPRAHVNIRRLSKNAHGDNGPSMLETRYAVIAGLPWWLISPRVLATIKKQERYDRIRNGVRKFLMDRQLSVREQFQLKSWDLGERIDFGS